MQNYRANPNYSRNTPYYQAMETPYKRPAAAPTTNNESLANLPIAMAYVPFQQWKETFPLDGALAKGTIFPELYKPFLGEGGCQYDAKSRY